MKRNLFTGLSVGCDGLNKLRTGRIFQNYLVGIGLIVVVSLTGCATSKSLKRSEGELQLNEASKDVESALGAVAGALRGEDLSEQEVKVLKKQLFKDKEARTAVESITSSFEEEKMEVKYCPVDGQRYAPHIQLCPKHHVSLESVK